MPSRQPAFQKKPKKNINKLMGRSAFVTGASGFIGTHLCRRLLEEGVEVYALSRARQVENDEGIHWFKGDLVDFPGTSRLIKKIKPDLIFNLAGYPVAAREVQQVQPSLFSNLVGTVSLLTAATEVGCSKVILTGSLEEPETPGLASSPYAVSKWACSAYARMFHSLYHLPVTIARVFMVYGPGQKDTLKLVPYVIRSLRDNESPRITSGSRQIDWIYVSDVVDGFLSLATAEGIEGKSADLGSGNLISTQDLVMRIASIMGSSLQPTLGAVPDRLLEQVRVADVEHTYNMIQWRPVVSLNEGLQRTIEFFGEERK